MCCHFKFKYICYMLSLYVKYGFYMLWPCLSMVVICHLFISAYSCMCNHVICGFCCVICCSVHPLLLPHTQLKKKIYWPVVSVIFSKSPYCKIMQKNGWLFRRSECLGWFFFFFFFSQQGDCVISSSLTLDLTEYPDPHAHEHDVQYFPR